MSEMVLYSTGCPKCNVLKKKLSAASIKYKEVTDIDLMHKLSIDSVPVLKVDTGLLNFSEAVKFINEVR